MMKLTYQFIVMLAFVIASGWLLSSCSDDEDGTPRIRYVRITKPTAADSLLVSGFQSNLVAIMGENLGDAREVWFNDQQAVLVSTYVTNSTIITTVPSEIPEVVTNKLTVVFANGHRLEHDFVVEINAPLIKSMNNEYAEVGETVTIRGDFFYEPVTVTFAGDIPAEIISSDETILQVIVPDGAQPGAITVATTFGATESGLWYKDTRNIIVSMEDATGGWWWGADKIVSSDPDIEPINNKFLRVNTHLSAYQWFEFLVAPADSDIKLGTKNLPADAIRNPEKYYLKFEINTQASLTGALLKMYIGNNMPDERGGYYYGWTPNLHTNGKWETIQIPFEDILAKLKEGKKIQVNEAGYGVSFWFHDGPEMDANFAMDNIRVVPKVVEE